MDRRAFLTDAGGLLGVALGAPLAGCATRGGVRHERGPVPVGPWLDDLARQERALVGLGPGAAAAQAANRLGLPVDFVPQALTQLLVLSAVRDLPPADQAHPAVQRRAWRAAVRNGQLTLATARALERVDPRELGWLREPGALAPLRHGVLSGARGPGIVQARRDQLLEGVDTLQWRLARQGPGLVFAEQRRRTRRLSRAAGLDRASWDGAIDMPVPTERVSYPDHPSPWKQMHTSERIALIGATICGLGVGLTLGGLFVLSQGNFLGVFGLTYGVLAVIGGCVVLMVAAGKAGRERQDPEGHVTRGIP